MGSIRPNASFSTLTRQIFIIGVPVILQNMAFYMMTFINSAFLGHYDVTTLSAMNNAMFPFFMLFTVLIALSQGTTVLIAHSIGANDKAHAAKIAESSVFYSQLFSFGYCIFWIFCGRNVLQLMGVSGEILEKGTSYIQIFSLIFLTGGLNIAAGAIFQGIGKTSPIMTNTILRAILNIILDYCLIFGNFGFPKLGLAGAAIASVISSTICALLLFRSALHNGILPMTINGILKPERGIYKKVFIFGAQAGMEFVLFSGAQVILIRMLNVGDQISAGLYGILNTIVSLSFNLYIGVGTAAMTLVGQRVGAQMHYQVSKIGNVCALYGLLLCVIVASVYTLLPQGIVGIFTNNSDAVSRLTALMPLVVILCFPKSINVIIGNAIRGTGDVRWMLMTQIAGTIIIISVAAVFVLKMKMGLYGVMLANVIDESWRSVINYIKFLVSTRKSRFINDNGNAAPPVKKITQHCVAIET
ncbi:MAG: MATE family efflux transporter [Fibrobacter sp.]|nr:MATE family efflux transporter [Fibrobacter sp.]